ncbi:MAG: TlyA family RNA methyltransferase [Thermodesulfovibrionales bacterium]|nr:TlyA family RNA methyltransferase [Thermodesulfovibrionales bacterium]
MKKDRLDRVLVQRGLVSTRERAKALIMEGKVLVSGHICTKPGTLINSDTEIELKEEIPYVSRGGLKLEAALEYFNIDVNSKVAMDVGASTGGFTDCLLKRGAKKVYCIDVGYGQLAWSLRNDPRVILFEKTNIRYLPKEAIPEEIDIITVDVSFISLTKVLPKIVEFLKSGGEALCLVKPQFEVGKKDVGKGGIVRDEEKRLSAVEKVATEATKIGFSVSGSFRSPLEGQKGNVEYFLYLKKE